MGTSKLIDSSAALLFEVPELNSPLVVQELQIGGTRNGNDERESYPLAWAILGAVCGVAVMAIVNDP